MASVNLYSSKGVYKGGKTLPKNLIDNVNMKLLAQSVRVYRDNKHFGLSKVKSRGEVSLSTRKIYRQKGTGYARHGAKSAPIFVGGGIAHGPKGLKRNLKLNKKMRKSALISAFSLKAKNKEISVIDGLSLLKKTKEAAALIDKISSKEKLDNNVKMTVYLSDKNIKLVKIFRNLKSTNVDLYRNLNAEKLLFSRFVLIDSDCFAKEKVKSETKTQSKQTIQTKKTQKSINKTRQKSSSKSSTRKRK